MNEFDWDGLESIADEALEHFSEPRWRTVWQLVRALVRLGRRQADELEALRRAHDALTGTVARLEAKTRLPRDLL